MPLHVSAPASAAWLAVHGEPMGSAFGSASTQMPVPTLHLRVPQSLSSAQIGKHPPPMAAPVLSVSDSQATSLRPLHLLSAATSGVQVSRHQAMDSLLSLAHVPPKPSHFVWVAAESHAKEQYPLAGPPPPII